MIAKYKKIAVRFVKKLRLYREAHLDTLRYYNAASWSGPLPKHYFSHLEGDIIKHYHVVEKGMTMPDFRPQFGMPTVKRLIELINIWRRENGDLQNTHFKSAYCVLRAYYDKHNMLGIDVGDIIPTECLSYADDLQGSGLGGTKQPEPIKPGDMEVFDRIAITRHSSRNFREDKIPNLDLINSSIDVAKSTPSVCNRQTWRVHAYTGDLAQSVLAQQNGNRGFGHTVPIVLVITSDMRYFSEVIERYQAWIEGGMFSMNLQLALHARGVGSVALNWSQLNCADVSIRQVGNIPDHERIIMLIGCGYTSDDGLVACSTRFPAEHFVTWH